MHSSKDDSSYTLLPIVWSQLLQYVSFDSLDNYRFSSCIVDATIGPTCLSKHPLAFFQFLKPINRTNVFWAKSFKKKNYFLLHGRLLCEDSTVELKHRARGPAFNFERSLGHFKQGFQITEGSWDHLGPSIGPPLSAMQILHLYPLICITKHPGHAHSIPCLYYLTVSD